MSVKCEFTQDQAVEVLRLNGKTMAVCLQFLVYLKDCDIWFEEIRKLKLYGYYTFNMYNLKIKVGDKAKINQCIARFKVVSRKGTKPWVLIK